MESILSPEKARELYTDAERRWSENYSDALEDVKFSVGLNHFDDDTIKARGKERCLLVNVLPQFINQVKNDIRQNTPSIKVIPDGVTTDEDTAEVVQEIIRGIEYDCNADEAYDTAAEYAIRGGFGWIRVDHDYCDDDSDEQKIIIMPVKNPFNVYIDPDSIESDGSDAKWGLVLDSMPVDKFKEAYPDKACTSFTDGKNKDIDENITFAEFFYVEEEEVGEKGRKRWKRKTVHRFKFSGADELERTTFPGKYIPLIPVYGEEVWIENERKVMGLIRHAKGPQKRLNVLASVDTERLLSSSGAEWIATAEAVEGYENEWANPERVKTLIYNKMDSSGQANPEPRRQPPAQVSSGFSVAMQQAYEDVKRSLGMYDAALGQRSNETSGRAINARKVEAEMATFHFGDNLVRSITQVGRVIVGMMATIYDTKRLMTAIDKEENPYLVGVNGAMAKDQEFPVTLTEGKYKVRVTTGASFTTKRQEAANFLTEIVRGNPEMLTMVGDLMFKSMDVAGADAMAERMKKMLPPQLQENEEGEAPDPEKMKLAQMLEAQQMLLKQTQAELAQLQQELKSKQGEMVMKGQELQLDREEAMLKAEVDRMKLQLDQEKLALEKMKLLIEADRMQAEVSAEPKEVDEMGLSVDELQTLLQQRMQAKQKEEESSALEAERERQEMAMKQAQTQAVLEGIQLIAQQLNQLSMAMTAPKRIIKDAQGRPIGVEVDANNA